MVAGLFALSLVLAPPPVRTDTTRPTSVWRIDVSHSALVFKIRHVIGDVSGRFTDWSGTIAGDPGHWDEGSVEVVIQARSIDTSNDLRDTNLRSDEFFDSDRYPEIRFRSTAVHLSGGNLTIDGNLTMKGVTRPVILTGRVLSPATASDSQDRAEFEVSTSINRLDYGISWNRVVEGGGMLLGDDVGIEITVAAVRQPDTAAGRLGGQ